jgi:hypothetical protein
MLYYLTEVPHSCAANDVNAMAIEEATKIIRGHDVVEEYLAYGILPLIYNWSHEIERMDVLLSKLIVPLPKVAAMIGCIRNKDCVGGASSLYGSASPWLH